MGGMKLIDAIIKKWLCCHEWEVIGRTEYLDCFVYFLKCKKCGKLKRKSV